MEQVTSSEPKPKRTWKEWLVSDLQSNMEYLEDIATHLTSCRTVRDQIAKETQ